MSWSCRSRLVKQRAFVFAAASILGIASTMAAEVYVQPTASLSAEYDSNLDLDTTGIQSNQGYTADAATLIGIATPDTDTTIKPRLRYEDFPQETSLSRLEAMLDFNSRYTSTRSNFLIFGRFDHLNELEAEIPSAVYNDVNPVSPTSPQTGEVNVGVTRDNFIVEPKYSYNITPLVSIGASSVLETLSYSHINSNNLIDFNYYQGQVFVSQSLGARASISLGEYVARYQARNLDSNATSTGETVDFDYRWSPVIRGEMSLVYQASNIDQTQPGIVRARTATWGASYGGIWQLPTAQFRLNVGRTITPSGAGGLYTNEQAQSQYDRNLTERLSFSGAVLFLHSVGETADFRNVDRNYATTDLSLMWMMTRTWFVQGGYSYAWQRYLADPNSAANNRAYLRFGYRGLPRQP